VRGAHLPVRRINPLVTRPSGPVRRSAMPAPAPALLPLRPNWSQARRLPAAAEGSCLSTNVPSLRAQSVTELVTARRNVAGPQSSRSMIASRLPSSRPAAELRLDEDHQGLGHHAVIVHRLGPWASASPHGRVHVGPRPWTPHSRRVLRVDERPDVGDANGPKNSSRFGEASQCF